jgi:hypothetical protein
VNIFEDINPRALTELLGQIHSRETALPDFQRDFVWDPNATQELIVSIAMNYPAGSLLRIQNTHQLFAAREFQGAPPLNGQTPTYLVLDGQQRLTSLYQAFYGVGDHRYFLRLRDLLDGRDFEECIFHLRHNVYRAKELAQLDVQARELILPLSVLRNGPEHYHQWILAVTQLAPESERFKLQMELLQLANNWIKVIGEYAFPVVTLSGKTSADAVCTIFETLNRTGVKLTVFELLTARFYPKGIRLRELWEKAQTQHPIIAAFEIDPYYVLQIVALASAKGAPSCKRSDVLDLTVADIEAWWDRAVQGMARGLALLRDECGVLLAKWLPYYTILIPLGAVLAKRGEIHGPQAAADKEKIKRWFWCSIFGQAYENSPNTQAAKDVTELLRWLEAGQAPETVTSFKFDPRILRDSTPTQRAIYRGTIALILSGGPRDLHTSDRITTALIESQSVDDHHIFPNAYLQKLPAPVSERLRNCVLNRTLIDKHTNVRISDRAPADYMQDIQGTFQLNGVSPARFRDLLSSHLIPSGPDSPLWTNDFEAFLTERQILLWQEIERVTGAVEEADLLSDEVSA